MNSAGTVSGAGSANAVLRIGSGSSGTATFNQSAGVVHGLRSGSTAVQLNIGRFAGNPGVYNLSGGFVGTGGNGAGGLVRIWGGVWGRGPPRAWGGAENPG